MVEFLEYDRERTPQVQGHSMRDTIITKYSICLNMRRKRVSLEPDEDIISIIPAFCSRYSHFVQFYFIFAIVINKFRMEHAIFQIIRINAKNPRRAVSMNRVHGMVQCAHVCLNNMLYT